MNITSKYYAQKDDHLHISIFNNRCIMPQRKNNLGEYEHQ